MKEKSPILIPLPPLGTKKILLHSCCAPCSCHVMEILKNFGIELTVLFYNPNIHPNSEYERRKNENKSYAQKLNIPFIDADYDVDYWFKRIKGLESQPERGKRCTLCFDLRLEYTAKYAFEHGFNIITSSLGISRWKDMEQVNACGIAATRNYSGMIYWTYNWRRNGGAQRMYEIAKKEGFYQQEYCGCVFSLKDANRRRDIKGKGSIEIGQKYYASK